MSFPLSSPILPMLAKRVDTIPDGDAWSARGWWNTPTARPPRLWANGARRTVTRIAPNSIDATVRAGSPAEVQVEEQSLGALPATVTLRPYSVNIYSYPIQ